MKWLHRRPWRDFSRLSKATSGALLAGRFERVALLMLVPA
jgi:hypothetical protein